MPIQARVFLVGCPRSGTTLLQCLLGAHSRIAAFPETAFYTVLYPDRPWAARLGLASRRVQLAWNLFARAMPLSPELASRLPRWAVWARQCSGVFVSTLDELAREQGKDIWLEKSPGHLRVAETIQRLVPRAKFIHLLRDGPDVVASLYDIGANYANAEWGREFRSLDACIERWTRDARLSQSYAGRPDHCLVRYEDVVADAPAALAPVCAFVGVAFEAGMLSGYAQVADRVIRPNETWKAANFKTIGGERGSKFHTLLSAEQQAYVLARLPAIV
jgi:hypothetical protein